MHKVMDKAGDEYGAWTGWCADDVLAMDESLCANRAWKLIEKYEARIIEAMVDAGWNVLSDAVDRERRRDEAENTNSSSYGMAQGQEQIQQEE